MHGNLDDHPLVSQLNALKAALDKAQDELQRGALELRHQHLKASSDRERVQRLEQENQELKQELEVLRKVPHPDATSQQTQAQQFTLSLRKLSDQLSLTEETVLAHTTELNALKSEVSRAKLAEENAYELAARIRGREEALKQRERELEHQLRVLEENCKMSDLTVNEYANLVRSMTGKTRNSTADSAEVTPSINLMETKAELKRLMEEYETQAEKLKKRLDELQGAHEVLEAKLDAQQKAAELDRGAKSRSEFELDRMRIEDNTAAKMVARYMKFSQAQTDILQNALTSLKTRHAATIDTLSSQSYNLNAQLQVSQISLEKLRTALDDLGCDIMKESFGRRNEVSLRIRMVSREERLHESIHRWLRRSEESLSRLISGSPEYDALVAITQEAKHILSTLDTPLLPGGTGSSGRMLTAHWVVERLKQEFKEEKSRQLRLRRAVAELGGDVPEELLPEDEWIQPRNWLSTSLIGQPPRPPPKISEYIVGTQSATKKAVVETLLEHQDMPLEDAHLTPSPPLLLELNGKLIPGATIPDEIEVVGEPKNEPAVSTNQPEAISGDLVRVELEPLVREVFVTHESSPSSLTPTQRISDTIPPSSWPALGVNEGAPLPVSSSSSSTTLKGPMPPPTPPASSLVLPISQAPSHPLLQPLRDVKGRYDDLQRGLRDCHLGLQVLTQSMATQQTASRIPRDILQMILDRLNDFVEDARVELEIRISDEELLVKGYETLLSIPGAMSMVSPLPASASVSSDSLSGFNGNIRDAEASDGVEQQIEAFIEGTDSNLRKARETFTRKLEDAEHDIAALKRVVHNPDSFEPPSPLPSLSSLPSFSAFPSSPNSSTPTPSSNLLYPTPRFPTSPSTPTANPLPATPSSSPWTSWIRNASSPITASSASSASPATFGNIMTSPRLRHSPSLQSGLRRPASLAPSSAGIDDVLSALSLRIPVPKFTTVSPSTSTNSNDSTKVGRDLVDDLSGFTNLPGQRSLYEFNGGVGGGVNPASMQPRARTTSTMYMLGIGSASGVRGGLGRMGQMQTSRSTSSSVLLSSPLSVPSTAIPPLGSSGCGSTNSTSPTTPAPASRRGRIERDIDGDTDVETDTDAEGDETETEDSDADVE